MCEQTLETIHASIDFVRLILIGKFIVAWNLRTFWRRIGIMRMSDFEDLPLHRQLTMLYQQGIYIGKSKQEELTRLLFQLEYFYIEITYTSYPSSIYKIHYTESTSILEPYLGQIQVEYLVT